MNFSEKIRNYLNRNFLADDAELFNRAKLSADEVSAAARSYGESEGWSAETMRPPHLVAENGKIIWRVRFASVDENNLPVKGGHLILLIDDETGKVCEKIVGTR